MASEDNTIAKETKDQILENENGFEKATNDSKDDWNTKADAKGAWEESEAETKVVDINDVKISAEKEDAVLTPPPANTEDIQGDDKRSNSNYERRDHGRDGDDNHGKRRRYDNDNRFEPRRDDRFDSRGPPSRFDDRRAPSRFDDRRDDRFESRRDDRFEPRRDDRYDSRRDDRFDSRRDDRFEPRREYRFDSRGPPSRFDDRRGGERYDSRRDDRFDSRGPPSRFEDRREDRFDSRRDDRFDSRRDNRSYERRPYERRDNNLEGGFQKEFKPIPENVEPSEVLGFFKISRYATEEDIRGFINNEVKGVDIQRINVIKDRETQESRGFAFIYFANVEMATKVKEELAGKSFMDRELKIDYSIKNYNR